MAEAAGPGERQVKLQCQRDRREAETKEEREARLHTQLFTITLLFIPVMNVHVRSLLTSLHMTLTLGIAYLRTSDVLILFNAYLCSTCMSGFITHSGSPHDASSIYLVVFIHGRNLTTLPQGTRNYAECADMPRAKKSGNEGHVMRRPSFPGSLRACACVEAAASLANRPWTRPQHRRYCKRSARARDKVW